MKEIKSVLLFAAGICWLLFAAVIGLILIQYFMGGAGVQLFGFLGLSSITVVLGVGHVIGLMAAAFVCFTIGMLLCLHGLIPVQAPDETSPSASPSIPSSD